ncbi:hypothetical protein GCM10010519_42950 [Streptomyces lactacystinicus]
MGGGTDRSKRFGHIPAIGRQRGAYCPAHSREARTGDRPSRADPPVPQSGTYRRAPRAPRPPLANHPCDMCPTALEQWHRRTGPTGRPSYRPTIRPREDDPAGRGTPARIPEGSGRGIRAGRHIHEEG